MNDKKKKEWTTMAVELDDGRVDRKILLQGQL